jgi:hypothetical protein
VNISLFKNSGEYKRLVLKIGTALDKKRTDTMSTIKEKAEEEARIKQTLLDRRIRLWKPPYCGTAESTRALTELAETLKTTPSRLADFQERALAKLKTKGKLLDVLQVKVLCRKGLGLNEDLSATTDDDVTIETWAQKVEKVVSKDNLILKLHQVNPDLVVSDFILQLSHFVHKSVPSGDEASRAPPILLRLVYKGTTLQANSQNTLCSQLGDGISTILCLVQVADFQNDNDSKSADEDQDMTTIRSIRNAAGQLQRKAIFDVTDAEGKHVSMTETERLAFMTALGLHAMGMHKKSELNSALVYLLEADQEWHRGIHESWRYRVDNYG